MVETHETSDLSAGEEQVLLLRFGFSSRPHSRNKAADVLKASPAAVRKMEAEALRKLRCPQVMRTALKRLQSVRQIPTGTELRLRPA